MIWKRKKKKEKQAKESVNFNINVIPDIFYGGNDPLIYQEQKKQVVKKKPKEKILNKKHEEPKSPVSKKKVIIISAIILLLFTLGTSAYYLRDYIFPGEDTKVVVDNTPKVEQEVEDLEPVVEEEPEETEEPLFEDIEEPKETEESNNTITFPNILLVDSTDIDVDSLTDEEEIVFETDSGIWDSDNDGYYDGQEVFNLYNPKGFAPVKIIDSGLVREYLNPNWQYRVYYPSVWEVAGVDNTNNHVIFSSITGDFIEVRSFTKMPSENFAVWFAKNVEGQIFADLAGFSNRFDIDGYKRKDSLVAYFVTDNTVFVMVYQPSGNATNIPYRHVMQMMYQSFRPSSNFTDLPGQVPLPQVTSSEILP